MLYDPKWGKPSLQGLIAWLELHPVDKEYDPVGYTCCVMGQYHNSIGVEPPLCLGGWMAAVAFHGQATFGAALKRARQLATKDVAVLEKRYVV